MTELLATLLPILIVDVLNPVLLGLLVFAAGSQRALANSASLLLGHTIAYLAAGFAVSFGVESVSAFITEIIENPKSIDFVVGLVIGTVCLYWAVRPSDKEPKKQKQPEWELTPVKCLAFGGVVNFIGVPFALPYFAAVDQILKADLSFGGSLSVLGIYNIAYALPFAAVPVAVLVLGDRSKPPLERLNEKMLAITIKSTPWLLGALGTYLVTDAVYFFIAGKPLF